MNDLVKSLMAWGGLGWPGGGLERFYHPGTIREPAKNHPGFGGWLDCWLGCPGLAWIATGLGGWLFWAGWAWLGWRIGI